MSDFLIDHALANVWCTPDQDLQGIFKPKKVSMVGGNKVYITLMNQRYLLPTRHDNYFVYQIGQVHPSIYNLFTQKRKWFALSHVSRVNNVVIDIYADNGIQFPRFTSWMMVTENNNLLIAVKDQAQIPVNLVEDDLYLRFYSNAYFASERSMANPRLLYVYGKVMETQVNIVEAQNLFNSYATRPGVVYAFVNGIFNTKVNLINVAIGDVVEFVYDSTVKAVLEIPVSSMETFTSILDEVEKYIVHNKDYETTTIDFHDDIDFWLTKKLPNDFTQGIYYHKNSKSAVRMLTHKDYAIPSGLVDSFVASNSIFNNVDDVILRLHVRHSGYERPLVDEHHRIKELYKLPDDELMKALTGIDSTIPEWKAEELENSEYTRIMRQYRQFITKETVTNAYGYNAISKLVGDSPLPVEVSGGTKIVNLPVGFDRGATVYEYNAQGHLLGFYNHNGGLYYPVRNDAAAFIEPIVGIGSQSLDLRLGVGVVGKTSGVGYRLYKTTLFDGVVTNNWQDVTGSDLYTESSTQFIWNVNPTIDFTAVRRDNRFLAYQFTFDPTDTVMRFSIRSEENYSGVMITRPLLIPLGRLDIWLNGRALVEGIDFHVNWPEVCIVSKEHRLASGNVVTVRATGFPNSDLSREVPDEKGFVSYGVLSRNSRFDIRDDKVMRFVVGGRVLRRSSIKFQEDTHQLVVQDPLNGRPYLITDEVVPIQNFATEDTYSLRAVSNELDKRISEYLSLKLPEPVTDDPSAIPYRYPLVSPFLSKIIHDVREGNIERSFIESFYSTQELRDRLESYEELLRFDPTQPALETDPDYCVVHPHERTTPIELTLFQWQFIKRVVETYLYNRVDLTHHITIEVL